MKHNATEQIFSVLKKGNIRDQSTVANSEKLSKYVAASPFPDSDVSFNWMMCAYPYLHYHDYFEAATLLAPCCFVCGKKDSMTEYLNDRIKFPVEINPVVERLVGES